MRILKESMGSDIKKWTKGVLQLSGQVIGFSLSKNMGTAYNRYSRQYAYTEKDQVVEIRLQGNKLYFKDEKGRVDSLTINSDGEFSERIERLSGRTEISYSYEDDNFSAYIRRTI